MKKKKLKLKKKALIIVIILFIVIGVVAYYEIDKYNEEIRLEKEKRKAEILELYKKKKIESIESHYNNVVVTNNNALLYKLNKGKYKKIGSVSKGEIFNLEEIKIDEKVKYFKIKDLDLYVDYKSVDKYNDEVKINDRYKNYIPFNENIISKDKVKLYKDGKLIYTLDYSIDEEVIIKDVDGYYVEYFNELYFIKNEDVAKTYEKSNSNVEVLKELPVTVYHFIYLNGDTSCNELICHSENQIKEQFNYLRNNKYFTMNTTEARLFLEGKLQAPRNSILITIDDGARAENFIPILEEYGINATLFLITSWYPVEKFKSDYLEIASHTDDLHHPGKCSGGQGSPLKCLDKTTLVNDLKLSRSKLNNTEAFCFPFYEFNDHAIDAVKSAGFKMAFIGGQRKASKGIDLYKVPRIAMQGSTTLNQYINYIK